MHLASEFLRSEPCFVQSARGGTGEIVAKSRVEVEAGKCLLCQEDFGAGLILNVLQDESVTMKGRVIHQVAGSIQLCLGGCLCEMSEGLFWRLRWGGFSCLRKSGAVGD